MCWVGWLNPLPAAGVGPLPSGVGFAAVAVCRLRAGLADQGDSAELPTSGRSR